MRRKTLSLLATAATALAVAVPPASAAPASPPELRTVGLRFTEWNLLPASRLATTTLAPGVTLSTTAYGRQDSGDRWTVQVNLPALPEGPLGSAATALGPRATALRVASALRAKGFEPRVEEVRRPGYADLRAGTLGWTVRLGRYAGEAAATELLGRVKAAGFAGRTRYTAQDGTDAGAPERVHVLRLDFRTFGGDLAVDHGRTLNGTERLTDLIGASGAIAGVNGQWFYNSAPGGLYVRDGKLLGSATQGRTAIRFARGGRSFSVDTFTAHVTLRTAGGSVEVDGVNRIPGEVWNCGGVGGDLPTQKPQHDLKCTDPSELVRFTPEWGAVPKGAGAEAVFDANGRVTAVNSSRGAAVPAGGSTLQAVGDGADWLLRNVRVGEAPVFEQRVRDGSGRDVPLTGDTTILQVGPSLVRNGRIAVNAVGDGVVREGADQSFTYDWTVRANPRSMIGVDRQGRLLLVVVDGRQAGYSEGLGIDRAARLMQHLGAVEAMNLDGGGSSVVATAASGVVNRPSDTTGQRSLGNGLLVLPRGSR
ncbi:MULTISPECIES: phosphodiester glycosidase family protein [unclassified Streptomyces]|uniref:phosphodiester glycosidase family protein n=1 Tax=unclassified Streptomyces TaxID=2593676 RepID=UPI0033B5AC3A